MISRAPFQIQLFGGFVIKRKRDSYTFWKTKIWFLFHMFMFVFFCHLKSERKQNYKMFHVDHQNVSHPNNYVVLHF